MQQSLHLVKVVFITASWVLDFIASKKGQVSGQYQYFYKKRIIYLDIDLQQPQVDNAFEFSKFKFKRLPHSYPNICMCIIHV
jgi:hypothetical protein